MRLITIISYLWKIAPKVDVAFLYFIFLILVIKFSYKLCSQTGLKMYFIQYPQETNSKY